MPAAWQVDPFRRERGDGVAAKKRKAIRVTYSVRKPKHSNFWTCRIWIPELKKYKEISTGIRADRSDSNIEAAEARAKEIYANWITTRRNAPLAPAPAVPAPAATAAKSSHPLDTSRLALKWLEGQVNILADVTIRNYSIYIETHLSPVFPSLLDITTPRVREYYTMRLKTVLRQTACHELSCLRQLCKWAVEMGLLGEVPVIPNPPRRALGTKNPKRTRYAPDALAPEEIDAIIALLPATAPYIGVVRARFALMAETALRPTTLDRLSTPEHWSPGAKELTLSADIMKTREDETKPLSAKAIAALEEAYAHRGGPGLLFGQHNYRPYIAPAATAVLDPARSKKFCAAHLRSAAISNFLDAGATLPAAMLYSSHKRASTTDRYIRARPAQLRAELVRQGRL